MNYGSLISEAFWLTWRHRFLWFFGFFVGGASFDFNYPAGSGDRGGSPPAWLNDLAQWISDNLALFLAVAITLVTVMVLILIALSVLSQGALAESVAALHRGEPRRFRSTWRAGLAHFWGGLGLKVLFFVVSLGLILAVAAPAGLAILAVRAATESLGPLILVIVLVGLLAIALLLPAFVLLYVIQQLALRELVVGEERLARSIGSGYELFRRNPGRSLLVWVIQVALALGIGTISFIVFLILGLVLFGPVVALFVAKRTTVAVVVGVVAALLFLVPSLVISGAVGTFKSTYWTLAYLRLVGPAGGADQQHRLAGEASFRQELVVDNLQGNTPSRRSWQNA